MSFKKITALCLICLLAATNSGAVLAETPEEWVKLGKRVHGGFGSYIALGVRIGLDAMKRLDARQRDLKVTYQDGQNAPCPCVVDGIAIATVASPGQNSLQVLPNSQNSNVFGIAKIEHKETGKSLHYVIPSSARSQLDRWNQDLNERQRYDAVMNATASSLFNVTAKP